MAARQTLSPLPIALLAVALVSGCAGIGRTSAPRISELADRGDDLHRASQRLVLEGLDADARGERSRARARYERALQIDASNPWAYLALARHHVDARDASSAEAHLDRAVALLESTDRESPGALLHCDGLRGAVLELRGRHAEARVLLDAAARADPAVWGDGRLSAAELR